MNSSRPSGLIGITGGIGSGKTAVTDYLQCLGYAVCDADLLARQIVHPGMPALDELVSVFGCGILSGDGALDRSALSAQVFGDSGQVAALNRITHTYIGQAIDDWLANGSGAGAKAKAIPFPRFLSAPLLFESGMDARCDLVWLVTARDALRIARAATRDGSSEADIRARMAHQMPESEKRKRASLVIENDEGLQALYRKIDAALETVPTGKAP
jgi:dephospho-CoA kinase